MMNSPKKRSGHSLIEMMGTLSVLLVLGIAAAKLMTSITQIGFNASQRKTNVAMIERLSGEFRTDIAQAQSISIAEDAASIELTFDNATIQYGYEEEAGAIKRTETVAGDQGNEETAEQQSFEQYKLTVRCRPRFVVDEQFVTLELTPSGQPNPWAIEAAKP